MIKLTTILLAAVFGLGACGGQSTPSGDGPTAGPGAPGARTSVPGEVVDTPANDQGTLDISARGASVNLSIEMDDFFFNDTFFKAAPAQRVTVALENVGAAPHTFTIESAAVDLTIQPGKTATTSFTLPASGALEFHCTFHHAQGMHGAFYFNDADKPVGTDEPGDAHGGNSGRGEDDDTNRY